MAARSSRTNTDNNIKLYSMLQFENGWQKYKRNSGLLGSMFKSKLRRLIPHSYRFVNMKLAS